MDKEFLEEVYFDSSAFNKAVKELYLDGLYDSLSEANRLAVAIRSDVKSCDCYVGDIDDELMKKALRFVGEKSGSGRLVIFENVFLDGKKELTEFFKALTWLNISCGDDVYVS